MAIPSTGALSFTTIQTEFGGSNPISLSEYYAGGGYVPSGTSGTNGAVPTSGQISVNIFYGTSNVTDLSWSGSITETQVGDNDTFTASSTSEVIRGFRGYHSGINSTSAGASGSFYYYARTQQVNGASGALTRGSVTESGQNSALALDDERSAGSIATATTPTNTFLVGSRIDAFVGRTQGNVQKFSFYFYLRYASMGSATWNGSQTSTAMQTSNYNAFGTACDTGATMFTMGMQLQSGNAYEVSDTLNTARFYMGTIGQAARG